MPRYYIVVIQTETDGDIEIRQMTKKAILELSRRDNEFIIIYGDVIKSLDSKIDFEKVLKD